LNKSVEAPNLTLSIVSDNDAFAAMADEWRALSAQASACFFMSWEWHYTWWQVYSASRDRLYIVRFTLGDKLIGLLPMYANRCGLTARRTMLFLGTGEARNDEVATEYLDVIAHPDHADAVANAALDWLAGCKNQGGVELRFMLDDALLVKAYRARSDLFLEERNVGFRYRVDLSDDESTHLENISKSRLKRIERSRRALIKAGGLKQESVDSPANLEFAFKRLAELNHERQANKGRKSVFASAKFGKFHHQLVERVFEIDAVDIHQFTLESKLLAVVYCFYDKQNCYYYQSGFSKRAANRYMPLTFAHLAEIERNRGLKRDYYDLMRAEPPSYKEDFGCETTPMVSTYIFYTQWRLNNFNFRKSLRRNLVAGLGRLGVKRR